MQERPYSFPESLSGGPPYSEGRKEGRKENLYLAKYTYKLMVFTIQ